MFLIYRLRGRGRAAASRILGPTHGMVGFSDDGAAYSFEIGRTGWRWPWQFRTRHNVAQLVTTKTKESARRLPFGDFLAGVFTDHMQSAEHIGPEDFVFCKTNGMPHHPDVLWTNVLYPALDRLRIPRIPRMSGFYAFRHAVGSIVNGRDTRTTKEPQAVLF